MKKKTEQKKSVTPGPRFTPHTSVVCRSLVTDQDGVSWWVNPETQTIKRA